jgi:hypothetical protein
MGAVGLGSEGRLDALALLASDALVVLRVVDLVVFIVLVIFFNDAKVPIAIELEVIVFGLRAVSRWFQAAI